MPDLQADVPENADQALEALALRGRQLPGQQDEQVDVGARVKLAAPVAAGRHQGGATDPRLRPGLFDSAVDKRGMPPQQQARVGIVEVLLAQRPALLGDLRSELLGHHRATC
jgi:hypothetical protein